MINLRRFVHTSCRLERGRTAFYNIHQKVTDPAKQDPEYFEKKARDLPLDENYIDALSKLYYEKIGSERDLGLKAVDNLILEKTEFGLPRVEKSKVRAKYEDLDLLTNAPESVKKIFSVEMATRRELSQEWKQSLIKSVRQHSLDDSSLEMKIAWLTALIRHWSLLVNDIGQETKKKPTWLTHRIWLVINERRKALRILREQNESAFKRTIEALKISYHVPKQPAHVKTRKAWAEAQLKLRVENEKEKRLEKLHEKYDKEVEEHKRETQEKRRALEEELNKLTTQMHEIDVIEGKSFKVTGKYEPALISSLTETVIHSNLFYHPPPTMTEK
uniref:Small ribosomal subunit protein uS15m n=1 Tax=Caenorhabditis japonica TaxID=281687 RepID=A0A8R1I3G2_CAEJA